MLRSLLLSASLLGSTSLALVAQEVPAPPVVEAPPALPEPVAPSAALQAPTPEPRKADLLGAMAWVPKGASAVFLVNHPARTLEALAALATRMKLKGAGLMRQTLVDDFGGEPLLDLESSLVEFSYPLKGEKNEAQSKTVQVRVLRVPSMKEFTARFKAKASSGGFFEGLVKTVPTVAAFRGGYALLAPKGNLAELKEALAEREVFPLPPQSQQGWLSEQDVSLLLPVAVLAAADKDSASRKDSVFTPVDALMAAIRKNPDGEVSHIAIGAKVEEGGGLSFEAHLGFLGSGQAAQALAGLQGSLGDMAGGVTTGLPAAPYAMAMTAALPAGYAAWLASTLEARSGSTSPEIKQHSQALIRTLQGLKALGFVWTLGAESARPLQAAVLSLQVENASASLDAYAAYAQLKPESGEAMASERGDYLGRALLKLSVPVPKPAAPKEGEASTPALVNPAALFGPEPLTTLVWAYDPHTLLVGFGEPATAFGPPIQALEHPETGLGRQPAFALTQDMLGADQQMQIFLSLQDIIGAAGRVFPLNIPLPASAKTAPPLGLGFSLAASGLIVRAVAPAETAELVGSLLESALKMSQDAKAAQASEAPARAGADQPEPSQPKVKKATKKPVKQRR